MEYVINKFADDNGVLTLDLSKNQQKTFNKIKYLLDMKDDDEFYDLNFFEEASLLLSELTMSSNIKLKSGENVGDLDVENRAKLIMMMMSPLKIADEFMNMATELDKLRNKHG